MSMFFLPTFADKQQECDVPILPPSLAGEPGAAVASAAGLAASSSTGVGGASAGQVASVALAASGTGGAVAQVKEAAPMSTIPGVKNELIVPGEEKLPKYGFKVENEAQLGNVS